MLCNLHVILNRRKESLQPFIRGGVRKVASEDLFKTRIVKWVVSHAKVNFLYLVTRSFFELRSRRDAVLVDLCGGGFRHFEAMGN